MTLNDWKSCLSYIPSRFPSVHRNHLIKRRKYSLNLDTFIHSEIDSPTTISEIKRIHNYVSTENFLGLYAYATQSGVALFEQELGDSFWNTVDSRWVFGIDYGRTQPQALRKISSHKNVDIRVYDGQWVVDQEGFIPRRDFHTKIAFMLGKGSGGLIVGSGNFSSNGLCRSVEAGVSVHAIDALSFQTSIAPALNLAESLWQNSTPLAEILDLYEERWVDSFNNYVSTQAEIFWIEAGYVTKNRGAMHPGNQIDLPRGMSKYFGFNPPEGLPANSVIGEIVFLTPNGEMIAKNLRLGNNLMEKVTLPIPETHGFNIYDGKVIVFQREGDHFITRALEIDDFETVFGHRLIEVKFMGSGRRYGHIR